MEADSMELKYMIEDKPPWNEMLLYGMQWLAVTIPAVIILGKLLGSMDGSLAEEILYLQKLFAVMGAALIVQIYWGHRLPLVIGPATVLLIGILASQDSSPASIYSCLVIGGGLLFLLSATGLFARFQFLFTPRVVAVILLLVAFTMTPSILKLISSGEGVWPARHLSFAFVYILSIFAAQRFLKGLWKSTLILWAMIAGSLAYWFINPTWLEGVQTGYLPFASGFASGFTLNLSIEPGLLVAFLLCYLGLSINDLGSIQAVGTVLQAENIPRRITTGMAATGLANMLAGFMGVIGPVNFSFSPGVIASTGCASRRTLVPAGAAMLALAFLPRVLFYLSLIPSVVIGCILLYIMCTQVAAGLLTALSALEEAPFDHSLLIGLPILVGVIVAFLPPAALAAFPESLRPILGNGFVVGIVCSLILEHVVMRRH